ncbi:MAG TPA: DUF4136 domain-containing protein [Flavobacteriales bacterium]|nr:DUF4136 domain-containing protein [Flavobacteriales bacterium]
MQQRKITWALALAGIGLLSGCYPGGPEYIDEYDLVYTDYSSTVDFKAKNTYSLPDSVIKLSGDLVEGERPEMVSPVYANEILGKIRDNMNSYGWTEVDATESPDVVILPSAIVVTNTTVYYPGYYWGWYYPYYGYGWYYPGYYPPTVTSYTTGSLFIQMTNPNEPGATDNIPVEWIAVFNGLLEGSTSGLVTRIDRAVDQAFKQSPYLKQ